MFMLLLTLFQIPYIAKGIGKRTFKSYLESFFDAIFYSVVRFFFIIILATDCNHITCETGDGVGVVPCNYKRRQFPSWPFYE